MMMFTRSYINFTAYVSMIKIVLKNTRKGTLLKFYKVTAVPTLLYACENLTLTVGQMKIIEQCMGMKFPRLVAGYNLRPQKM